MMMVMVGTQLQWEVPLLTKQLLLPMLLPVWPKASLPTRSNDS